MSHRHTPQPWSLYPFLWISSVRLLSEPEVSVNYPHAFFFKAKGILQSPPSVCPSVRQSVRPLCYLLLNHWTKFNQIWCVSYSHEWGVQQQIFFGHAPWDIGEGSNGQISFNFNYKVNFKDFYTKLCMFSQMNDTKHIRRDFHFVAWVMPQGWDLGALVGAKGGGSIFFFKHGHVAYQTDGDDEQNRMQVKFSS